MIPDHLWMYTQGNVAMSGRSEAAAGGGGGTNELQGASIAQTQQTSPTGNCVVSSGQIGARLLQPRLEHAVQAKSLAAVPVDGVRNLLGSVEGWDERHRWINEEQAKEPLPSVATLEQHLRIVLEHVQLALQRGNRSTVSNETRRTPTKTATPTHLHRSHSGHLRETGIGGTKENSFFFC